MLVCLALAGPLPAQSPSRPHWFQEFPAAEPLRISDDHSLPSYPFARETLLSATAVHLWVGGAADLAHVENGSWRVIRRHPVTAWQRATHGFWPVRDSQLTPRSAIGEVVAVHSAPSPATTLSLQRDRVWFLRSRQLSSMPADGASRQLLARLTSIQHSTTWGPSSPASWRRLLDRSAHQRHLRAVYGRALPLDLCR